MNIRAFLCVDFSSTLECLCVFNALVASSKSATKRLI